MSQDLKLSICLATYNRAKYIGETIESILPQLCDGTELLVVDGASTDETPQVVEGYLRSCAKIRYFRLPVKGGVDRDYDRTVSLARGEYCWLFTDDDILKPGAISAVLAAISEGYGLIVVNAEVRDIALSKVLLPRKMDICENKIFAPGDIQGLFEQTSGYLTFIGGVVIRKDTWLQRQRTQYYGTEFIHLGVIFQSPLSSAALAISETYICIRLGNAQWTPRAFDIWMFKWPALIWSFESVPDESKSRVVKREPWRSLRELVSYRRKGLYHFSHYLKYFHAADAGALWKFMAFLISWFPRAIMTGVRSIFR